jgi:hypothetical protein
MKTFKCGGQRMGSILTKVRVCYEGTTPSRPVVVGKPHENVQMWGATNGEHTD